MRIGILGAGNIGGALGRQWAARGHEILFGVRDPQSYTVQILMNSVPENATTGTMREAAQFGEVVALAVPWQARHEVLGKLGDLTGKILIDCTNRVGTDGPDQKLSGAEEIAHAFPRARVVKGFNTLGAESLAHLRFGDQPASTFICGDDAKAKAVVRALGEEIGFDVVDVGSLASAELIESLARLWLELSFHMGRDIAFALLRRPAHA
jgi:8-hydroxy-5-deazaflavin:NADPH oxidoreductase